MPLVYDVDYMNFVWGQTSSSASYRNGKEKFKYLEMFAVYLSSMILHIEYLLTQPFLACLQSDVFEIYSHCILGKLNYIREVDHNDSFILQPKVVLSSLWNLLYHSKIYDGMSDQNYVWRITYLRCLSNFRNCLKEQNKIQKCTESMNIHIISTKITVSCLAIVNRESAYISFL